MNSRDQEKLLKELLPKDDLADFRETSLERGLTHLRRQRRTRHVFRAGSAIAAVFCLLALGIFLLSPHPSPNKPVAQLPQPVAAPETREHVTFISDDELLSLFKNQPVALIGKPGQQRLVLLNKTHNETADPF